MAQQPTGKKDGISNISAAAAGEDCNLKRVNITAHRYSSESIIT